MPKMLIKNDVFVPIPGGHEIHKADTEVILDTDTALSLALADQALYLDAADVPKDMQPALRRISASAVIRQAAAARRMLIAMANAG